MAAGGGGGVSGCQRAAPDRTTAGRGGGGGSEGLGGPHRTERLPGRGGGGGGSEGLRGAGRTRPDCPTTDAGTQGVNLNSGALQGLSGDTVLSAGADLGFFRGRGGWSRGAAFLE